MGKPRGKMNQTQKAAVRQLEEEFGTNPNLARDDWISPEISDACSMPLETPDGRDPLVLAVWFIRSGEEIPRFVTAYPVGRRVP